MLNIQTSQVVEPNFVPSPLEILNLMEKKKQKPREKILSNLVFIIYYRIMYITCVYMYRKMC